MYTFWSWNRVEEAGRETAREGTVKADRSSLGIFYPLLLKLDRLGYGFI